MVFNPLYYGPSQKLDAISSPVSLLTTPPRIRPALRRADPSPLAQGEHE